MTSAAQTLPVSRVAVSARRSPPRVKRKRWEWRCSRGSPTALAGFSSWPPTRQAPASANRSVPSTSCWAWSRKMTETSRSPRTPTRYSPRVGARLPCLATTTSVPNTSYSPFSTPTNRLCSTPGRDDLCGLRPAASADRQASCRGSPGSLGPKHLTISLNESEHALCAVAAAEAGEPIGSMDAQHDPHRITHTLRRSRDLRRNAARLGHRRPAQATGVDPVHVGTTRGNRQKPHHPRSVRE